jgi:hypothetical protein
MAGQTIIFCSGRTVSVSSYWVSFPCSYTISCYPWANLSAAIRRSGGSRVVDSHDRVKLLPDWAAAPPRSARVPRPPLLISHIAFRRQNANLLSQESCPITNRPSQVLHRRYDARHPGLVRSYQIRQACPDSQASNSLGHPLCLGCQAVCMPWFLDSLACGLDRLMSNCCL